MFNKLQINIHQMVEKFWLQDMVTVPQSQVYFLPRNSPLLEAASPGRGHVLALLLAALSTMRTHRHTLILIKFHSNYHLP